MFSLLLIFLSLPISSLDLCEVSFVFLFSRRVERDLSPFSRILLSFVTFFVSDWIKRGLDRASPRTSSAIP